MEYFQLATVAPIDQRSPSIRRSGDKVSFRPGPFVERQEGAARRSTLAAMSVMAMRPPAIFGDASS